VRPFVRGNLTLPTWLASTSTHANFGVGISNPVEPWRSLGIASKFPDVMEKANAGPIVFSGSLEQRQLGTGDWDALLNATGFAAKAQVAVGVDHRLGLPVQVLHRDVELPVRRRRAGSR
jgi:hypothetical protein